jgi:hypothetical protein
MSDASANPPVLPADDVVPDMVLVDDFRVAVARATLGLTFYLDDAMAWARQGARAVLLGFMERVNARDLRFFTTSVRPGYHDITGNDMARLLHDLPLPATRSSPRHLFWLRLVDDGHVPTLAFSYREIDSDRQRRSGFLELTFPADFDPRVVADFAALIADQWPILCGTGGYQVSWNLREGATAHSAALPFCRRFLGLDLQDADELAWRVPGGVAGTGWLTLVGRRHAETLGIDLAALAQRKWEAEVTPRELKQALLLRAGEAPTLGDLNRLAYPSAYAEVARMLAPYFIEDPPLFLGEKWREEPDLTARWMRRFVDPEGWR